MGSPTFRPYQPSGQRRRQRQPIEIPEFTRERSELSKRLNAMILEALSGERTGIKVANSTSTPEEKNRDKGFWGEVRSVGGGLIDIGKAGMGAIAGAATTIAGSDAYSRAAMRNSIEMEKEIPEDTLSPISKILRRFELSPGPGDVGVAAYSGKEAAEPYSGAETGMRIAGNMIDPSVAIPVGGLGRAAKL